MFFNLAAWQLGPIERNRRNICGHDLAFRLLPIRERFDLGIEMIEASKLLQKLGGDAIAALSDPVIFDLIERLRDLSDAPEELFDADLTAQLPVAATAAEIQLDGFFDGERMTLAQSTHRAVRKLLAKPDHADGDKIAPNVKKHWFLYRPVYSEMCTYEAMFVDERFSFFDIHRMHELLDLKQLNEIVAHDSEA